MTDETRKPQPTRESAQNVLNKFLKENNLMIGTDRPDIDVAYTQKGQMVITITPPKIISVYNDELKQPPNNKSTIN
jgi:sRNA-binding carbon storage regulator CsrA